MFTLPPATRALLLANIAVFLLQMATPDGLLPLALAPPGPYFHWWQLVTYAFLHEGWAHLFFNMFALFMFGSALERTFGPARFLALYFASVLAAAGVQLATEVLSGVGEPTAGASGGIFGLLLAFGFYFPRERLIVLPIPVPVPAWLFVTVYGLIELFLGVTGREANVAHFAHLGGMLGGALTMLLWQAEAHARSSR